MKIRLFVLTAALLFIAAPANAVQDGDLIGGTTQLVQFGVQGAIVLVSQTDGSQALIGDPTANGSLSGLAFDLSGALWGANNIDVASFRPITELIQIDPNTGTQIGPSIPLTFNGRPATVQDLAVQPGTDVLFAVSHFRPFDRTLPANRLVTIDKSTGAVTIVGTLPPVFPIHGIGFDPNTGALYDIGGCFADRLFTINPADASVVSAVFLSRRMCARGLGVDANGTVWVSNVVTSAFQEIFTVNPATGQTTSIGGSQFPVVRGGVPALLADLAFVRNVALDVDINIKPGSDPNSINTCSGGATPVAIFGTATLDVTTIDPDSLVLASATVKTVGKSAKILCNIEDIGSVDGTAFDNLGAPDGFDDLVCHFVTIDLTALEDSSMSAGLTGNLNDGTPIEGEDSVNVVKDCDPS